MSGLLCSTARQEKGATELRACWLHCFYLRVLHQNVFHLWLNDFTLHMQCPDPHFKKRHHKRRVLQKPLVGAIVDNLMPGGQVYFCMIANLMRVHQSFGKYSSVRFASYIILSYLISTS